MAKGGDWERDVCKYLSKWIQGSEKPYLFWRGHGSGGTFTRNESVGERFAGDVYNIGEEGKFLVDRFTIEVKNGYKDTSFDKHLKYNTKDNIKEFWIQVCGDAERTNKHPMLIYKKKGFPVPWIGITEEIFRIVLPYMKNKRYVLLYWGTELPQTHFYGLHEFFEIITPDIIKEKINVL